MALLVVQWVLVAIGALVLLAFVINIPKIWSDYWCVFQRDPAARGFWGYLEVLLTYAGFHAIAAYRVAHFLLKMRIPFVPRALSQLARLITGVEIHPGALIGKGFFIDHGMGVVIGETTIVGENCTLFQGVTLGGTGKESGKRHPTLGRNVMVSTGAKILGNIEIGDNAKIGAGSVVLKSVPADCTVVGIPGKIVRRKGERIGSPDLDHSDLPDPIAERLRAMQREIECLAEKIHCYDPDCKIRQDATRFDREPIEPGKENQAADEA
ncbi:MAG TPA: serine O-acetyltransferase [bacterium]|nr:serine O-acetyltransferase [bacterium]